MQTALERVWTHWDHVRDKAPAGTPDFPHCLGPLDGRMPRLPAGTYQAALRTMSTSIRPVLSKPQPISLTAVR